jgi:hypothetical protein
MKGWTHQLSHQKTLVLVFDFIVDNRPPPWCNPPVVHDMRVTSPCPGRQRNPCCRRHQTVAIIHYAWTACLLDTTSLGLICVSKSLLRHFLHTSSRLRRRWPPNPPCRRHPQNWFHMASAPCGTKSINHRYRMPLAPHILDKWVVSGQGTENVEASRGFSFG